MQLFRLHLPVPGEIGPRTHWDVLENCKFRGAAAQVLLDGPVTDDLLRVGTILIGTRRLSDLLTCERMTGFISRPLTLCYNQQYQDIRGRDDVPPLPDLVELCVTGHVVLSDQGICESWSGDDICKTETR